VVTKIDTAERKRLILQRRRDRVGFREIAEELGISPTRVVQLFKKALLEIPAPEAAELRHEEAELIDQAVASLLRLTETASKDSDRIAAWGQVARFMDRRAKLFGLDAPAKQDITVQQVDPKDIELAELIREAQAKAAANIEELRRTDAVQE
jgi:hypothetical protein